MDVKGRSCFGPLSRANQCISSVKGTVLLKSALSLLIELREEKRFSYNLFGR